jgi:transposase
MSLLPYSLDERLPSDHRVRLVWSFVQQLDLQPLYDRIVVSKHDAGRPAIAPEILVALWLLATLDGVGSAREVCRRTETDLPYQWICGEVGVNYHTLSTFRSTQADFLDRVLVDSVTTLIASGLVPLATVAQDGMRVRANAGKSSFRRKEALKQLQAQTKNFVHQLKQ